MNEQESPTKNITTNFSCCITRGGIATSLVLSSCSNNSKKALVIDVSTPTITANGVELGIEGSYSTFNFDSPTVELVDKEKSFKSFDAINGTFFATLLADTDIGTYKLQLVAKNGDDNIYSNPITFIVGPFAASDGSNWSGRTSGTIEMTFDDANKTATIVDKKQYVAKDLVIPEIVLDNGKFYKVTEIGNDAFHNSGFLTGSLTIGSNVTRIGDNAFDECSELTGKLTIGSSVVNIGNSAFQSCVRLTGSLTIPDSVEIIGHAAFAYCSGFTGSLTIGSNVASIGDTAFLNCNNFTGSLTIPDSVESIYSQAFAGCSGFTNITLDGFDSEPSWGGSNIFDRWGEVGTVSVIGEWPTANALTYLKDRGLPDSWVAAAL